jgi:hypothetical protein
VDECKPLPSALLDVVVEVDEVLAVAAAPVVVVVSGHVLQRDAAL